MSNSWWKKLFNLDNEDDWEEQDQDPSSAASSPKEQIGRLQDHHRNVRVRMMHKYPEYQLQDRYESSLKQVRKERRGSNNRRANGSERKAEPKKKEPFKPTEVPSPVYGFRKPPERKKEQQIKNDDSTEKRTFQGEKEKIDESAQTNQIGESPLKSKETTIEFDEQLVHQSVSEPVSEAAPAKDDLAEDERDYAGAEEVKHEQNTYVKDTDDNGDIEEAEPQSVPDEKDNHEATYSVPPYKALRRSSKVPYNVLMFRSDRNALQRKTKNQEVKPENVKERSQAITEDAETDSAKPVQLSVDLLDAPPADKQDGNDWIEDKQKILEETLKNFHVKAEIVGHVQGPAVTRFDIRLHPGVKINKVINLTEDIKLSMAAKQIRIAPVPGQNTVGIEIPNDIRKAVYLKRLLDSAQFKQHHSPLAAVLGQDVSGQNTVTDLSKMPHGLIAGATGSGKSVCIHSLIISLIYKTTPDMLRLILIDPKVVELAAYQNLPHLAAPVLTQPKEASAALKWAVSEMERRYQVFAQTGVRDISRYNQLADKDEGKEQKMPYIVIVIDELADLMMVSPQDVEEAICRIAQKARAAGIHLLLATQRPSVDVITGLIKSNIPTRIAFSVSSQADSRTIIDSGGAERLLGQGDMLFVENGARDVKRLQGCFVTDEEIDRITGTLDQMEAPPYLFDKEEILQAKQEQIDEEDDLFEEAGYFVIEQGQASVSSIQRKFRIGYNRAARLVDQLEALGIISEANGSKPRQILKTKESFDAHITGQEVY
ncbi:S-DNA-T family DNA segregation ATPase FtsK/SpoIIIE [Scopulibacillus darangshiensis]|uniref:S-DNA-T family DNA segregation ATPase FtsK/SpoIIIE n=1 Tax=Scopulibacillus darangshiensis TaxID=442528 RepID=A0A4V2SNQ0_9BACL|nr:DNA translocase FtsK [Scopulibacillus darangshiensis]TCP32036.1 S-DNA-T family DNA segregation ATPase FtsK/SpoIIIE [Scopulibacillus darangshiensis]